VTKVGKSHLFLPWYVDNIILNPLSNAQKTGFSEKPVFCSCTHAKRGINNQFLITGFSIVKFQYKYSHIYPGMVIYRQKTIRLGKKNKNKLSNDLEVVETREFNRLSIAFGYNYHNRKDYS